MGEQRGSTFRPWHAVWAKTERDDQRRIVRWLPLHQHLADSAGVAGLLIDRWVSPHVIARIGRDLPNGEEDVRPLAVWLAAVHDVGKASPAFVVQGENLAGVAVDNGLPVHPALATDRQRSAVSHGLVGHVAVASWLTGDLGFEKRTATTLASIVGSHHGVPPEHEQIGLVRECPKLAGTGAWAEARGDILAWATDLVGGPETVKRYAGVPLSLPNQVLLSAIVIMADWVASNSRYFPLDPLPVRLREPEPGLSRRRLERGWGQLALPARWVAASSTADADTLLAERFGRGGGARPLQHAALRVAREVDEPGLMILEAPMGEGKTEAALLAAEVFAARTGADGCLLALPTRATSDAMLARVADWLDVVPGRSSPVSLTLAHGTASLNERFEGLLTAGFLAGIGQDAGGDEAAIAHSWLCGRKKNLLAQFVVGTIDQVLLAALKSKHVMLRHLGLAGKVVVVDEVHAYDTYMNEYLLRALHWLGAYRVPVVLLSATLPSSRRAALVEAYDSGASTTSASVDDAGYPVIVTSGGAAATAVDPSARSVGVGITRAGDDLEELAALLEDRLRDGGCAVVVRNTVRRVQETADRLSRVFGEDAVTVNHSRYLAVDRARTDRELLRHFGPPGLDTDRPDRHVVVASQVVEQSLDVDFDVMVTDLAPADLLLQRMGRLHRHRRSRPARVAEPECVVVGVDDWEAEPVEAVRASQPVYGRHTLLRAAALVVDRDRIDLPADISSLVEQAYGAAQPGPPTWQEAMTLAYADHLKEAMRRRDAADTFRLAPVETRRTSLIGWITAGVGDAEDDGSRRGRAQVRDGEETIEVLVVCQDGHGGLATPDWLAVGGGVPLSHDFEPDREVAKTVAACALRLPLALSHEGVVDDLVRELETRHHVPGFELTPLLKGQLVLQLDTDRTTRLRLRGQEFRLTYDLRRGLLHEKV